MRVQEAEFPSLPRQMTYFVNARSEVPSVKIYDTPWLNSTTQSIKSLLARFPKDPTYVTKVAGYFAFDPDRIGPADEFALPAAFISANGMSSAVSFVTEQKEGSEVSNMDFVPWFRRELGRLDTRGGNFSLSFVGWGTMADDAIAGTVSDLALMDGITLPIALMVLVAVVGSMTSLAVPLISVVATVAVSFAAMVPIAHWTTVSNSAPAIMMSLTVAMSVDYSLFMVSRYKEELASGRDNTEAVRLALRFSGGIILTSGSVLTLCFLGLCLFPVDIIQSVGISAVVTMLVIISVSLTLVPSLLLAAGKWFFSIPGLLPCIKRCPQVRVSPEKERQARESKSLWFRFASFTTRPVVAVVVILLVLLLCSPFCLVLLVRQFALTLICLGLLLLTLRGHFEQKLRIVADNMQSLPRGAQTVKDMRTLSKDWPIGSLYPYQVIAVAKAGAKNKTILCPEFFNVSRQLVDALVNTSAINATEIMGISYLGGTSIEYSWLFEEPWQLLNRSHNVLYPYIYDSSTNERATSTIISISPHFDPGTDISRIPKLVRPILERFTARTDSPYEFHLISVITYEYDCYLKVLASIPVVVGVICAVIAVVIALAFQSVLLPLRMLLTIGLTLAWSVGILTIIYSTPWLHWLGSNIRESQGVNWVVPILCFSILIGLGLDYDIFLFSRIAEFRKKGWSNRAAVIKGVSRTGHIITFAGIIMAIAFGGLAFSQVTLLNQFGLLLAIAVLLDTFVMRTTLSPAIIFLCGPLNYWPRRNKTLLTDPVNQTEQDTRPIEEQPLMMSS